MSREGARVTMSIETGMANNAKKSSIRSLVRDYYSTVEGVAKREQGRGNN